jgi:hypothetical protein
MRNPERGSAMLMTMIIITALLAGGAVLTSVTTKSFRGAELTRTGMTSLYCAESGLAVARAAVMTNYGGWNAALAAGTEPAWLASVDHDIDNDGSNDFRITLKDNDDETGPNDPTVDNDLQVFVVSTCVKYSEVQTAVTELVRFNGGGNCYQAQLGGCGGNNNAN